MAGHFVLRSITNSDLVMAQQRGCQWSALQHGGVGWTPASRAVLTTALTQGIHDRSGLPPHRYLQFGPFGADGVNGGILRPYLQGAGWADGLVRPNMGLRGLVPAAAALWPRNLGAAMVAQADAGATSIEIYYTSGYEIS